MDDIRNRLQDKGVSIEDFQAANAILISKGYLSKHDGARHRKLYQATQNAELVFQDALTLMYGATLHHDSQSGHYRLLPFGTRSDGMPDPGDEMEIRRELKSTLFKDFVASVLTLKLMYDEMVVERRLGSDGRVTVRITDFIGSMKLHFKVDFPAADFNRKSILARLKKNGIADVDLDNFKDEDAIMVIRPEIQSLVMDSAIVDALAMSKDKTVDTETDEPNVAEQPNEQTDQEQDQ